MCFPFISEVLAFTTSMPSLPTELPLVQKGELSIAVKKAWCSYGKSPLLKGKLILDIYIYVGERLEVPRKIEEPWVFLSYTGGGFGEGYGKDRAVKPIIKFHTHGFASHTYFGLFRGCKILWNHLKWFLPNKQLGTGTANSWCSLIFEQCQSPPFPECSPDPSNHSLWRPPSRDIGSFASNP